MEKLHTAAEQVRAESWKWVETDLSFAWGHTRHLVEIDSTPVPLSEEETTRLEALRIEQEAIEAEYAQADELPDEVDSRLGEIEQAIETLETRLAIFDPGDVVRAGAFISLDSDGTLLIERGFAHPEDMEDESSPDTHTSAQAVEASTAHDENDDYAIAGAGEPDLPDDAEDEEDVRRPISERLLSELTAWRTLALRDALAGNPHVALTEFLHTLCLNLFRDDRSGGCLEAGVRSVALPVQSADLATSMPAHDVRARHEGWKQDLPQDEDALWVWLDRLDETSRLALLAHCLSFGVNALFEKTNPHAAVSPRTIERRLARSDRLASALRLDPVEAGWQPTVENYLGRVTKPHILDAVRAGGRDDRPSQEGRHGARGRTAARGGRLVARCITGGCSSNRRFRH